MAYSLLFFTGTNIALSQLQPYEGASVRLVQDCIAAGNASIKISIPGGKTIYGIDKIGRFNLVEVEAFDGRRSKFRYEKTGKRPEQGKCYTKQKEKFSKDLGVCCTKVRAATTLERLRLKQNIVCEMKDAVSVRSNVYNLKSDDSINFVGSNDCKEIGEALTPVYPSSSEVDCNNYKPFEFPKECKGRI